MRIDIVFKCVQQTHNTLIIKHFFWKRLVIQK